MQILGDFLPLRMIKGANNVLSADIVNAAVSLCLSAPVLNTLTLLTPILIKF